MAWTAHNEDEYMKLRLDGEKELKEKIQKLVEMIKNSKHCIISTGAGVSTSAGIPDYRGPEGLWTMKKMGIERKSVIPTLSVHPTPTHMAIVKLMDENIVKYLISQILICDKCKKEYYRDWAAVRKGIDLKTGKHSKDHFTGRYCDDCGKSGKLQDSTIDFYQNLPEIPLEKAFSHAKKADLIIVMGTSCTVAPASTIPTTVKKKGGKCVIINLQKTPLYKQADLNIFAKSDYVMSEVLKSLKLKVPKWNLKRKVVIENKFNFQNKSWSLSVRGLVVDKPTDTFYGFRAVRVDFNNKNIVKEKDMHKKGTFHFSAVHEKVETIPLQVVLTLFWFSNTKEPPMKLLFNVKKSFSGLVLDMHYDFEKKLWEMQYNEKYNQILSEIGKNGTGKFSAVQRFLKDFRFGDFKSGFLDGMKKKIENFNEKKIPDLKNGSELVMKKSEISELFEVLHDKKEYTKGIHELFEKKLLLWPNKFLFPVLDILRLLVVKKSVQEFYVPGRDSGRVSNYSAFKYGIFTRVVTILKDKTSSSKNKLLIFRFLCNLFEKIEFSYLFHKFDLETIISNSLPSWMFGNISDNEKNLKDTIKMSFVAAFCAFLCNFCLFLRQRNYEDFELVKLNVVIKKLFSKIDSKIVSKESKELINNCHRILLFENSQAPK